MLESSMIKTFTMLYGQQNPTVKVKKMVDNLALELMGETWVWPSVPKLLN